MLGDLIGEEQGKITVLRVLDSGGGGPKVEVNMRTNVKILGLAAVNLGTYCSAVQPRGFLYGEGQGIGFHPRGRHGDLEGPGSRKDEVGRGRQLPGRDLLPERVGQVGRAQRHGGGLRTQQRRER